MTDVLHFLGFVLPWCIATAVIRNEPPSHPLWASLLIGACGTIMYFSVRP